jgi:hypothetical protein
MLSAVRELPFPQIRPSPDAAFNVARSGLSSISLGGRGASLNIPVARPGQLEAFQGSGLAVLQQEVFGPGAPGRRRQAPGPPLHRGSSGGLTAGRWAGLAGLRAPVLARPGQTGGPDLPGRNAGAAVAPSLPPVRWLASQWRIGPVPRLQQKPRRASIGQGSPRNESGTPACVRLCSACSATALASGKPRPNPVPLQLPGAGAPQPARLVLHWQP